MTPSQKTEINNLITEIDKKIILAALIPSSFDPRQAPLGTDLDLYDDICGGFKSGENHSYEDLLDYLTSTTDLISNILRFISLKFQDYIILTMGSIVLTLVPILELFMIQLTKTSLKTIRQYDFQ